MNPQLAFVTTIVLLVLTGCSSSSWAARSTDAERGTVSRRHPVYSSDGQPPDAAESQGCDEVDFQTKGPLEFLDYLRAACEEPPAARMTSCVVWGTHRGWILESDVPSLLNLLESTVPCIGVTMATSSLITMQQSTIGREAAFMIAGFRSEIEREGYAGYPPALDSQALFQPDNESIRAWWADYAARTK